MEHDLNIGLGLVWIHDGNEVKICIQIGRSPMELLRLV